MEEVTGPYEGLDLGIRMLTAQGAIHSGQVAIQDLLQQTPVDLDAVAVQRQNIKAARSIVKLTTHQLAEKRLESERMHSRGWKKW